MYVCMYVTSVSARDEDESTEAAHAYSVALMAHPAAPASQPDHSPISTPFSLSTRSSDGERARVRAHLEQEFRRQTNLREWFRRRMALLLCEQALAAKLRREDNSARQVAGRLSTFKRQAQGHTAESVVSFTRAQLELPQSTMLEHDTNLILQLLANPVPSNDHAWIYSSQVGRPTDPSKQRMAQHFQLLLVRLVAPKLQLEQARQFVHQAVGFATSGYYRDCILLLWPMLPAEEQFRFQQWYYGFPTGSEDVDAPTGATDAAEDWLVQEHTGGADSSNDPPATDD